MFLMNMMICMLNSVVWYGMVLYRPLSMYGAVECRIGIKVVGMKIGA